MQSEANVASMQSSGSQNFSASGMQKNKQKKHICGSNLWPRLLVEYVNVKSIKLVWLLKHLKHEEFLQLLFFRFSWIPDWDSKTAHLSNFVPKHRDNCCKVKERPKNL